MSEHLLWAAGWPWLLGVPVVVAFVLLCERARRRRLKAWIGARTEELAPARRTGAWCFAGGVMLAMVALLQPLWGHEEAGAADRRADIMICLDVSRSMLARDQAPDRLTFAHEQIRALLEEAPGDRFGLVVFAGEARVLVPLTRDHVSFSRLLEQAEPLAVARGGSDLAAAIRVARAALPGGGAIVLLTDGEDHGGEAARAAEGPIPVHCIGIGSERGAKIPIEGGFIRDRNGVEVVSRADTATLRRIAEAGDGVFARNDALLSVYRDSIRPRAAETIEGRLRRERANRFQWPLMLAFLFLVWDLRRR